MPERLRGYRRAPSSLRVCVNRSIGIGGLTRRVVADRVNDSRNSREENPGTDWGNVVRTKQVYKGPKRSVSEVNSRNPLDLPRIRFVQDGIDKGDNLLVYFRFFGDIDLIDPGNAKRKACFIKGGNYHKLPGFPEAVTVYAILGWGPPSMRDARVIIGTVEDRIHCRVTSPSLPLVLQGFNLVMPGSEERYIAELTDVYDRHSMAISVLDPRLVKVRYDRLHV
ncbi:hypothetical protein HYU93_01240 [Candidatus Daviesbacteria bacterium]|nr:hypothetical protein [Candidatus Daviesbacteria bacterium]